MSLHQDGLSHSPLRNTIAASSSWDFFSFYFSISYIKSIVMYFIVNSFVGMVSKAVIKYSYADSKLSSKIITTSSFLTGTFKLLEWEKNV